jgi:hypothetical protein
MVVSIRRSRPASRVQVEEDGFADGRCRVTDAPAGEKQVEADEHRALWVIGATRCCHSAALSIRPALTPHALAAARVLIAIHVVR